MAAPPMNPEPIPATTPAEPDTDGTTHDSDSRWCVMRRDDNANDFVIEGDLSRAAAVALAETYERRGHKQLYWIRRQ